MQPTSSTELRSTMIDHVVAESSALQEPIAYGLCWEPRWIDQSPCLEHVPFLAWFAHVTDPRLVVGLGIGHGTAYFAMCQALRSNEGSEFYGIDQWPTEDGAAFPRVPQAIQDHNAAHYAEFSRLICSDPAKAADFFDLGGVDIMLVEQPLSTAVLGAIRSAWLSQMSACGVILLAGTDGVTDPEACELLQSLKDERPYIEFAHGGGFVALMAGPQPPAAMQKLARSLIEPQNGPVLEQQFRCLGDGLVRQLVQSAYQVEVDDLRALLSREGEERKAEGQRCQALEEQLKAERTQSEALVEKHQQWSASAAKWDAVSVEQSAKLAALTDECEHLTQAMAATQNSLVALEAQYIWAKAQVAERDERLALLSAERQSVVDERHTLHRDVATLKADADAAAGHAAVMQTKLDELQRERCAQDTILREREQALQVAREEYDALRKEQALAEDMVAREVVRVEDEYAKRMAQEIVRLEAERQAQLAAEVGRLEAGYAGQLLEQARQAEAAHLQQRDELQQQFDVVAEERMALRAELSSKGVEMVALSTASAMVEAKCMARERALCAMAQKLEAAERRNRELEADGVQKLADLVTLTQISEDWRQKAKG